MARRSYARETGGKVRTFMYIRRYNAMMIVLSVVALTGCSRTLTSSRAAALTQAMLDKNNKDAGDGVDRANHCNACSGLH